MAQVILVLGPHRTGTSAMTRVLALLGGRLPPKLVVAPDAANPSGYWESRPIGELHDQLLEAFGRSWADPRPLPEGWETSAPALEAKVAIRALLDDWAPGDGPLVLKDPRMCRLTALWFDELDARGDDALVVLPVRPAYESAMSLWERDALPVEAGARLWLLDSLAAESSSRGRPRLVVRYHALLQQQADTCAALADFLGLPAPGPSVRDAVAAFLDSSLHHHHGVGARDLKPPVRDLVVAVEAALTDAPVPDVEQLDRAGAQVAKLADPPLAPARPALPNRTGSRDTAQRALTRLADATVNANRQRSTDVAFVVTVERGPLEWQSIMFIESLRRWGGRLRWAPVYAVSPRAERRPHLFTRSEIELLGARYVDSVQSADTSGYGTVSRIVAGAEIERTTDHEVIVVVDSDTLVLRSVDALALRPATDVAARPVDVVGISTTGDDAMTAYWENLCRLAGIELATLPVTTTAVDRQRILANYNGGLVAVRRSVGILQRVESLYFDAAAAGLRPRESAEPFRAGTGDVSADVAKIFGSAQAAFSVAASSLTRRIEQLPPTYNVPAHSPLQGGGVPGRALRRARHIHYHWLLDADVTDDPLRTGPNSPLAAEQRAWLDARLRWRDEVGAWR